MYSNTSKRIIGRGQYPINNSFAVHEQKQSNLAIVLSGFGYTTQAPVLYYARGILWEKNIDILSIDFRYSEINEFMSLPDADADQWFEDDCEIILNTINSITDYTEIFYIGKSLGTTAMLNMLEIGPKQIPQKCIWLTPGTSSAEIYQYLSTTNIDSLVVAGSLDRFCKQEYIDQIESNPKTRIRIIDGAAHALENPDDTIKSIHLLEEVTNTISDFL
jgi:pimeloyl-ACP methyl ester carboxylesterase